MKILVVSTWFPFPPNNGSRIRTYHLLKGLGARHTVDLIAISQMERDAEYMGEVNSFCRRAATFPPRRFRSDSATAWWKLFTGTPRSFEVRHSPEMEALAVRWMEEERYDAVVAITLGAAPYALMMDAPLRVLDQHNVESQVLKRQAQAENSFVRRMRYTPTWIKAARFERGLTSAFDLITVVSEPEKVSMEKLLGNGSRTPVAVVPNGVDPALLKYERPAVEPRVITFTGAMGYQSNYDAALWLCREVLPAVRRYLPDVRLRITGKHDGADISEMARIPGVEFTGYVDDIRPLVASASALVVPLRFGGGTRLKILEAMALGTPVVSTPVGAEGIEILDGKHILLGKTAEDIAARTTELLTDNAMAGRISSAARELVSERYQWPAIADGFEAQISSRVKAIVQSRITYHGNS